MLRKLRERVLHEEEEGYSLIELLVVVIVIAVLAGIALPSFLAYQRRGQDSAAKSNARNLLSHMDTCFTTNETYVGCNGASSDLPIGGATGEVEASGQTVTAYTVTARSKSGNVFTVTKAGSTTMRSCTTPDVGGCPADGSW